MIRFCHGISRAVAIGLLLAATPAPAAPRIVASIAPLAEITAAVTDGIATVETIVPAHESAHHFALRPSHVRSLQRADLVIWIDRRFEAGFDRIHRLLPDSATRLELAPALELDGEDLHFWYSPDRLLAATRLIAATLVEIDPDNALAYRAGSERLAGRVDAWRQGLDRLFERAPPAVLTDHRFLHGFAREFGLDGIHALHDQHDDGASLGDLRRIEALLDGQMIKCLMTTEASPSPLATGLARKYGLTVISLSPDAASQGISSLENRLRRLARAFEDCGPADTD